MNHAIKTIAKDHFKGGLIDGTVLAVDKSADTMDFQPLNGGAELLGVKLASVENDGTTGADMVVYPAVGSYAVVGFINDQPGNSILVSCSVVDSLKVKVAGVFTIVVDTNGIVFNGGGNLGIPNVTPLVAKINALENDWNALREAFRAHTHPGVTVGGGVTAIQTLHIPDPINPITNVNDLQDTKITH